MLPQEAAKAFVIITKLEQPHKFDFALQCKCGFQSHGYANADTNVGDEVELARQAARSHLMTRHGAKHSELPERIRVTSFTTSGGMTFEQLDLKIQQTLSEPVKVPVPAEEQKALDAEGIDIVKGTKGLSEKDIPSTGTLQSKPPAVNTQIAALKPPAAKPEEKKL